MRDIIINTVGMVDFAEIIICTLVSLALGALIAFVHSYKNHSSRNFMIALSLLPAMVQVVIMMVNGNIGAGLAVAGAFTMVRFRSVTGNAKDIAHVFFAVAIGLATGMGELLFASAFAILICTVLFLYGHFNFGVSNHNARQLKLLADDSDNTFSSIEQLLLNNKVDYEIEQIKYQDASKKVASAENLVPMNTVTNNHPSTGATTSSEVEYTFTITLRNEIEERILLRDLRLITMSNATIRPIPYEKEKL